MKHLAFWIGLQLALDHSAAVVPIWGNVAWRIGRGAYCFTSMLCYCEKIESKPLLGVLSTVTAAKLSRVQTRRRATAPHPGRRVRAGQSS